MNNINNNKKGATMEKFIALFLTSLIGLTVFYTINIVFFNRVIFIKGLGFFNHIALTFLL